MVEVQRLVAGLLQGPVAEVRGLGARHRDLGVRCRGSRGRRSMGCGVERGRHYLSCPFTTIAEENEMLQAKRFLTSAADGCDLKKLNY